MKHYRRWATEVRWWPNLDHRRERLRGPCRRSGAHQPPRYSYLANLCQCSFLILPCEFSFLAITWIKQMRKYQDRGKSPFFSREKDQAMAFCVASKWRSNEVGRRLQASSSAGSASTCKGGPSATSLPSFKSSTRCVKRSARSRSWVIKSSASRSGKLRKYSIKAIYER